MTDKIFRIKKKVVRWRGGFCGWFLPTESPRDSKRQLRTVTWPIHRLKCRWNHQGIQNSSSVWWRVLFTIKIANGITDGIILSGNPSAKVNICHSANPLLPYFSFFFPIPTLPNCKQPPPKNKSPSSQHNKSYFLKFCGHNICVLIYRWILSVFISNSIFWNFNI